MFLVYADESGINFGKDSDGKFYDGHYILFGGLLVHENKYHHLERMFAALVECKLGISSWSQNEIHASDIWKEAHDGARDLEMVKSFFEELLQLLAKMSCTVVLGIQVKKSDLTSEEQLEEKKTAARAMIHQIEYVLAEENQNGVLIADKMNGIGDSKSSTEREFALLLADLVAWRSTSISSGRSGFTKFEFESRAVFLLSTLHHVSSKDSLMIQLVDCVIWIINRMFTYYSPKTTSPELAKCPVSEDTFRFFLNQTQSRVSQFSKQKQDFMLSNFGDFRDVDARVIKGILQSLE